jgi:hypothetical protein
MRASRRDFLRLSAGGAVAVGTGALPIGDVLARDGTRLPAAQLRALKHAVRGRVLAPGGSGYNAARVVFNRRFDGVRPPAVVRIRDAADVQAVVRWADRYDVPLVARSGGNGYNGNSTSRTAVVVDLAALDHVRLGHGGATVGPAARLIEIYAALSRRGVTVPSGSCPNVAVGGAALGGGMGLAGRAFGLTLDAVRGFDVVTADGRRRSVSARSDEDLFWALRGGGGNFAIVTGIDMRVRHVGHASWFRVTCPRGSRDELLAAWDDLAPGAPRELTSICSLRRDGASAFGQYLGSEAALRRLVGRLAHVRGARLTTGREGYLALQRRWAVCGHEGTAGCARVARATFAAASVYIGQRLSARARHAFVAAADAGTTVVCDAYGGAIARVDPDATAFVHRRARFSVQILSYAPASAARKRVRRARALIAPYGNGQAYQNYADPDQPAALSAWYGDNLDRLVQVKTAVDPGDRFRIAQGIRPQVE